MFPTFESPSRSPSPPPFSDTFSVHSRSQSQSRSRSNSRSHMHSRTHSHSRPQSHLHSLSHSVHTSNSAYALTSHQPLSDQPGYALNYTNNTTSSNGIYNASTRGRLADLRTLSPASAMYPYSPSHYVSGTGHTQLEPLVIPGGGIISPSSTISSPSLSHMDLVQLALRVSHLEQENIHLRHVQAEQSAEIRALRVHVDRSEVKNVSSEEKPQSSLTTDLMAYVRSIKPDHALTENERLGEDHIRRFSDHPKVRFWTESRWNNWLKDQERDGAVRVGQSSGLRGKGAKAESKRRRFLEDANGNELPTEYISRMRQFCRAFAKMMARRGCLPATWRDVDLHVAELFYDALRMKFPEIQLCDGNWKANLLMSQVYYDWKRPRATQGTKRPASPHDSPPLSTNGVNLADAKFTITAQRDSVPPAKIARISSPPAALNPQIIHALAVAPTAMNDIQPNCNDPVPVNPTSPPVPASAQPALSVHIDKGKQRAVDLRIFDDDLDHSLNLEATSISTGPIQGIATSAGAVAAFPSTSLPLETAGDRFVHAKTATIPGPAVAAQNLAASANSDRQAGATPAAASISPGLQPAGVTSQSHSQSRLPGFEAFEVPAPSVVMDVPLPVLVDVPMEALPETLLSKVSGQRKKDKTQEKPWPPPEGILQPKWTYARAWAAEHTSSTRQDFETHYAALSASEKKRISRQNSQKGQKNALKSG